MLLPLATLYLGSAIHASAPQVVIHNAIATQADNIDYLTTRAGFGTRYHFAKYPG